MKIGVLGGGQLGRMLGLAGIPLGHEFVFFDESPEVPAIAVGEVRPLFVPLDMTGVDVVTYEFENVESYVSSLKSGHLIFPPVTALVASADRISEKDLFVELGIPTARYRPFTETLELQKAAQEVGFPAIAKTCRFGYDGKGQMAVNSAEDLNAAAEFAGEKPMILESKVAFDSEVSIIGVRGQDGECRFYPLVENSHRDGILALSLCPAPGGTPELQVLAEGYARRVMERLGYVGVLAIEFFQTGGELLANEMAPRVHNSGHWTIEGAETSQFENHIRAITGMPLGSTALRGMSAMFNLIGALPNPNMLLTVPGAHLHLYGKEPRAGRKLGHLTLRSDDGAAFGKNIALLAAMIAP